MSEVSRYIVELVEQGGETVLTIDVRQIAAVSRSNPYTLLITGKRGWSHEVRFDAHYETKAEACSACQFVEQELVKRWCAALEPGEAQP